MPLLTELEQVREVLERTESVAVLGASHDASRPGFYVGDYLASVGYRVVAVNPHLVGRTLWGNPVVGTLGELAEPVDLIDVFRRSQTLPGHTDELLALPWKPQTVWFQLLVWDPPSAQRLVAAGIDVVQNRCTLADHRRLGIAAKAS